MSILVFGLGAAALLRAAHEEFVSNPTWRAPPETMFAQQAEGPVLAMLQIEPPAAMQKVPDNVSAIAAAAEPAAIFRESSLPEAAKSETPVPESPAQSETTSAQADTQADDTTKIAAPDAETRIASSAQIPPPQIFSPASETAPVAAEPAVPEQASTQASLEIDAASTKIATLGGVPIPVKRPPVKADSKNTDESVIKKRLQARRAAQRRRVAARARLAAQQAQEALATQQVQPAQQQAFGPFVQPPAPPAASARH
jgi:hypothetical protein